MNVLRGGQKLTSTSIPTRRRVDSKKGLAVTGLALLSTLSVGVANAFQTTTDDWSTSIDTTLSYGVSWRMQGRDKSIISPVNGGTSTSNTKAINADDSDLNYGKGDVYSQVVKVLSEMDLKYKDQYGLFVRGRAFYDFAVEDNDLPHRKISSAGLDQAGSDVELLDAFVYGKWDLNGHALSGRLGNQVINWGESLFYQNGVAATNPTDLSALRAPGSELKEAFLPTLMAYGSYHLTDKVTVSSYWQPGSSWQKTQLDPCGTYFANDYAGQGCNYVSLGKFDSPTVNPTTGVPLTAAQIKSNFIFRAPDVSANSASQYGVAVRWFIPELNDTELGFYYLRASTQTPQVGGTAATTRGVGGTSNYFLEYLDKRDIYGISFNTTINGGFFDGQSVFGEATYRPNTAIGLDETEILKEVLRVNSGTVAEAGEIVTGYREKNMYQATLGTLRSMGRVLGADASNLAVEMVASRINGLESDVDYGRVTSSAYGATASMSVTYNNVFNMFNLTPSISHARGFHGVSPTGTNGLDDEVSSTSLGVDAVYQDNLTVGLRYVDFAGAQNSYLDRDYLSINAKYSF